MTISTAILVAMSFNLGTSQAELEKSATDYDLVVTAEYAKSDMYKVNAAAASLLTGYLLWESRSEGGFSIALNTDEIKNRIMYLAKNSGGLFVVPVELQAQQRQVKAVNVW